MVMNEILSVSTGVPSGEVKGLGDSRASGHVRGDLNLLWDVKVREEPILLRQVLGELGIRDKDCEVGSPSTPIRAEAALECNVS